MYRSFSEMYFQSRTKKSRKREHNFEKRPIGAMKITQCDSISMVTSKH
jgi:hypothetical protein